MNLPRTLLVSLFLPLLLLSVTFADTEDDEKAETWVKMHRTWRAIMAYKEAKGTLPDYLSNLIPEYLPDADALISPTEKRTGRHGDNNYHDPKVWNSFCYEFSAGRFAGNTQTFREVKEAQMEEFGGVVPILRCFLYERVMSIAYSGDEYESALYWETSPEAKALAARIGAGPGFKNGEFTLLKVVDAESRAPLAEAEVRLTDRKYHFLPLPDRVLHTASDGTVRVPLGPALPPSRQLTVTISKAGYFAPAEIWKEGSLNVEEETGLSRGAVVGGIVKLADGKVLAHAQIEISLATRDEAGKLVATKLGTVASGEDGHWKCDQVPQKVSTLAIRVTHPAAWTTSFEAAEQSSSGRISIADLMSGAAEMRIPPAASLHGIVTNKDGEPVAGADVVAAAVNTPPKDVTAMQNAGTEEALAGKTDAEGRYSLPWCNEGKVALLVLPPAGTPARRVIEAAQTISNNDLRLTPGRSIRGRVLGDNGQPVSGAKVTLSGWGGDSLPVQKLVAETDREGSFSWTNAPTENVSIRITIDGYFDRMVTIAPKDSEPLAVRVFRRSAK